MRSVISKIKEEKGINVKEEVVNEPVLIKDKKDFYTNFVELELELDEVQNLLTLVFRYMPSHLEITSPERLTLMNNHLNDILNETTRRLHAYDEVVMILQTEKALLERKLKDILEKEKK